MKPAYFLLFLSSVCLIVSCKARKEPAKERVYVWGDGEESHTLTLTPEGSFELAIEAGYFSRTDTGAYSIIGDTLVLNPGKQMTNIDSLEVFESPFEGNRVLEVFEEDVTLDSGQIIESFYRPKIFPVVVVNNDVTLSVHPKDQAFSKLLIPDSLAVNEVLITVELSNTCIPVLPVRVKIPEKDRTAKAYQIYLRSPQRQENYLAGAKWIIRGDTLDTFFRGDTCEPTGVQSMIKQE